MANDVKEAEVVVREISKNARALVTSAEHFVCATAGDYKLAGEQLIDANKRLAALEAERLKITRPMDEAKKRVMDLFRGPSLLLENVVNYYKRAMRAYEDQQRREREVEQHRLDEIARKDREKLEQQARKAMKDGKQDKALTLATKAAQTAPVVAAPVNIPNVVGITQRTRWIGECIDVVELCRAVADGKVAPIAVKPNDTFINQQARALREHFAIPGCKAREEDEIAASRR